MIFCAEGAGRFVHKRGEFNFQKGDLVLLPPKMRHLYELITEEGSRWKVTWTSFLPPARWLSLLQWPVKAAGLSLLQFSENKAQNRLLEFLLEARRFQIRGESHWEMSAQNALERLLLFCDAANPGLKESRLDSRLLLAINYLSQHLAEPITLEQLAQRIGLSVSRVGQLFRKHMHQSPHRFLENQRIAHARQILETTDEPVSLIAVAAGFSDPFHFSRQFKKHTGCSPREYRRQQLPLSIEKKARSGVARPVPA